jgi:two-component system sensor histidine kinase CpxA
VHDFNYMAERLERLVGAQKILVRDVSHELRSPLARLSVALELAREESPPAMMGHLKAHRTRSGAPEPADRATASALLHGIYGRVRVYGKFDLNGLLENLLPDAEFEANKGRANSRAEPV